MKQAMFAIVFLIVMISVAVEFNQTQFVKYDCDTVETSPDYSMALKQQCRLLRLEQKNI